MPSPLIAPSILSANFARLADDVAVVEKGGADWLHVDVMDGHFVPNLTIGPVVVQSLKKCTKLPLDVHLMITDPLTYAAPFAKAGAWGLTFHVESVRNNGVIIDQFEKLGVKPAASIKPKTPVSAVLPILKRLHHILVMTVEPGFGGQSFMADMLPKVRELRAAIDKNKWTCLIEVDGGINVETGKQCLEAGADVLVAGNSIYGAPNPAKALEDLKKLSR
jgi:ribulose-phosphate 3-epimerase